MRAIKLVACLTALLLAGCQTPDAQRGARVQPSAREQELTALLWQRRSAEWRALCYQAYNTALMRIQLAQAAQPGQKLTIVVDLDETVIDNSALAVRRLSTSPANPAPSWLAWCKQRQAAPMPGAKAFLEAADALGTEIIYLTNRPNSMRQITFNQLKALGFPQVEFAQLDMRLTAGRSKLNRLNRLARRKQIILYLGNALNDFPLAKTTRTATARHQLVDKAQNFFGTQFILIPTPIDQDWENATLHPRFKQLTPTQQTALRLRALTQSL